MEILDTLDYDEAAATFIAAATQASMAAMNSDYASMRRARVPEGVSLISVQASGATISSPEVQLSEEVQLDRDDVMEGTLERFHEVIAIIAQAHLEQFMRPFYEYVGQAAEAVGNSTQFDAATFSWDSLLDAAEQVEWAVDDLGRVLPPTVRAGADMQKKLDALPEMTEQQRQRMVEMVLAKQEAHVSRRRSRRLR